MASLEKRKYLTPEQETKYAQLEQKQQQLEADLYSRDFRESPEFKAKYQTKADKVFQAVQNELKGIQIDDGEGGTRTATLADFSKIRALGDSQVEQRRQAKALFGDDSDVVIALARELKTVEDAANEEIESKRTNWASERTKQAEMSQQDQKTFQTEFEQVDKALLEKFADQFAPKEGNEEFNNALQGGLDYVDNNSNGFSGKTPAERAKTSAILRRWAGSYPANQVFIKQQATKIAELEATIAKLQGTDPGAGGDGGGTGGGPDSGTGGADALAEEINRLQQA